MATSSGRIPLVVRGFLGASIALVVLALVVSRFPRRGPQTSERLPVYGQIGDFNLTNQFGKSVCLSDLAGEVWIADIIFTRCAGPCPRMTRQMSELQAEYSDEKAVKFISLTTDPDYDHPDVLERYAARFGARSPQWWFLTGTKKELGHLGRDGLKLTAMEKEPAQRTSDDDLFIHSTIFALVDQAGRLRGVFETQPRSAEAEYESPESVDQKQQWQANKARIVAAVNQLLAEK